MLRIAEAEAPVEAHNSTVSALEAQIQPPKPTVAELIFIYAEKYGLDPNYALSIARCESGLNPLAKNPNSSASGVFQFLNSTWASVNRLRGIQADVFNAEQNIDNAMWLAKNEGWHHWECRGMI